MRKLQNTLYITTQGSYLHKERETLVVEQERKKVVQLPVLSFLSKIALYFYRLTSVPFNNFLIHPRLAFRQCTMSSLSGNGSL